MRNANVRFHKPDRQPIVKDAPDWSHCLDCCTPLVAGDKLKITIKVGNRLYGGDVSHKPEIGV